MSTFTMRTLAILPLLALTTLAQAYPSHAATAHDGGVTILPGLWFPPTAALRQDGMASTGEQMLGYMPPQAELPSPGTNVMSTAEALSTTASLPASVDLSTTSLPRHAERGRLAHP